MSMSSVKKYLGFCFMGGVALTVLAVASTRSIVVIADVSDTLLVSASGGDVNITLVGFSSVPAILDISDALTPKILSEVEILGQEDPFGAYLGLQAAAELYAAGSEAITEITSLQIL